MRIAQLDLKAFGHFTGRRLVFGAAPDFHIAYGPNEAGKTTISRALKAVLFGVPERTNDNFLHPNPDLRIGIVLARADGAQLAAMRRKARKNSLVAYDPASGEELGTAIADEELAAWLGGLNEGLYTSMFGLDHDGLVAGGRALSEGKGELGQSLFEAGAGLSSVRALRESLKAEADRLFRRQAPTTAVYKALEQYGEARKEARDAQTRPVEWEALRKAAEDAQAVYDAAREEQAGLQQEARRLERLAAVLPDVAARRHALARLADLGSVVRLPPEAAGRRLAAEAALRQAELNLETATANATQIRRESDAIVLPESLLAEAGAIEALYYGLKTFREARDTAAGARVRLDQAAARANALMAAMGEAADHDPRALIPSPTFRAKVQSLRTDGAELAIRRESASRQTADIRREVAELNSDLAALAGGEIPAALADVLRGFADEGNPESKATELARKSAQLDAELQAEAAALGAESPASLAAVGTPLPAELQGFRSRREELEKRRRSLRDGIEKIENDIGIADGELAGLLARGDVATAESLAEQRRLRDSLWHRIRRAAYPEPGAGPSREPLPEAAEYERAVAVADATADSRFSEAARVSQHADLVKRLAQMRNGIADERKRLAETDGESARLTQEWQAMLDRYRLPALGMAELGDWLARRELFLERHRTAQDAAFQAEAAARRAKELRTRLDAALSAAGLVPCGDGESLAPAVVRAQGFVEEANRAAASRSVLAKKRQSAETRLADALAEGEGLERALDAWQARWSEAMAALRLAADASDEEAGVRLHQFDTLEAALADRDTARAELAAAEAALARVDLEAERLCRAVAYERAGRPADAVVETLYDRLQEVRALAARRKNLAERLQEAEKAGDLANRAIRQAGEELERLRAAAGCATTAALPDTEQRSAEVLRLEEEVARIEERLVKASALPLPDVLAQAEGQDLALLEAALERSQRELEDCGSRVETLHAAVLSARSALARIDGTAAAAAAEQQAAEAAARLSTLIADFAAARLASGILADVIETYQQRHQGPLLARASELFSTITGGRFVKVAADFDEDLSILVGVRPNGRRETIANLSSGTRDQLFLALRLAAIESHVAAEGPMPVVVDDLVIHFDDAAAGATFRVLAELSRKTQVLFFTHHEHLLDRAAAAIGRSAFAEHRL